MTDPSVPPAVGRVLGSPRTLAAWALVGYAALHLFFTFLLWITPNGNTFSGRSAGAYADFTNLLIMAFPVLAVVLAAYLAPAVGGARILTLVALFEYAVSLFFGLLTFLIGMGAVFDSVDDADDGLRAFQYVVMGFATLALIAVAAYIVVRAFIALGGRLPTGRTVPPPTAAP